MQKSALIIIDLQAFIKKLAKDAVPYGWDKIIENNRALISAFDQKNQPVYIVTVEPKILWQSAKKAFSRMILQDELDKNPRLHQLVKYGPSAFKQSDYGLADELKNNSVSKLIFTDSFFCDSKSEILAQKSANQAAPFNKIFCPNSSSASRLFLRSSLDKSPGPVDSKIKYLTGADG